jgi:hypothetical protein
MPRDAVFVARLRYVSGLGDLHPQPVDLFMGGAKLWAAPLDARLQPAPIPARDVLRVDVWPELEGPPTLRVNFSPPAGDLTRDLVLGIMPNVPPQLVTPQLEAIAGVLTGLFRAEREAEELAGDSPAPADLAADAPPPSSSGNRYCSRCGETVPPGATACPRCAQPV